MAKISVFGVDLGKNVYSVVGLDASGAVVMRRRIRRETLIALAEKLPACVVGMEACCGTHHLRRIFADYGHDVRLMSPEYVRPYVKAQKNDDRDAEGISEATTRPTMRFVELFSFVLSPARHPDQEKNRLGAAQGPPHRSFLLSGLSGSVLSPQAIHGLEGPRSPFREKLDIGGQKRHTESTRSGRSRRQVQRRESTLSGR